MVRIAIPGLLFQDFLSSASARYSRISSLQPQPRVHKPMYLSPCTQCVKCAKRWLMEFKLHTFHNDREVIGHWFAGPSKNRIVLVSARVSSTSPNGFSKFTAHFDSAWQLRRNCWERLQSMLQSMLRFHLLVSRLGTRIWRKLLHCFCGWPMISNQTSTL